MTHADLVQRARRWLTNTQGCSVVVTAGSILCDEIPDALGWVGRGTSWLVECKASRADFRRDKHKGHRSPLRLGLGSYRYYLAEPGVIPVDELLDGWGLLECRPKQIRVIKHSERDGKKSMVNEIMVLIAHINRSVIVRDHYTLGDGGLI